MGSNLRTPALGTATDALPPYLRDRIAADAQRDEPVVARAVPLGARAASRPATPATAPGSEPAPDPDPAPEPEPPVRSPFAAQLRADMAAVGLGPEALARRAGVPKGTLYDVLAGRRGKVAPETAAKLAGALDVGPSAYAAYVAPGGWPTGRPRRTVAVAGEARAADLADVQAAEPVAAPDDAPAVVSAPAPRPAPAALTSAHVDALASFLPPRELVEFARQFPRAVQLAPDVALAHEALDLLAAELASV